LPKKYQKVVHMRYVQDLTLEEMSLITGQSKNAMAVQVHRGLEKLKLLYEPT
jgi:DNA-directed RNA polymerase specialized sigma24 family protein